MRARAFWKAVTMDDADLIGRVFGLLDEHGIRYCVIGGQGVNAYVEPVVSLDLDLVVATDQLDAARQLFAQSYIVEEFAHSLNISAPGSDLRVQLQTDPRYSAFVGRAARKVVLGMTMPVAAPQDVLRGKVWAAQDPARRPSRRQKDLADIARLLEQFPELASEVPEDVRRRLV
jgi:hypothetical protein